MNAEHEYSDFVEKNDYKVINCKTCGYWHVYPIPTSEELNSYYEQKYYSDVAQNQNRTMTDKKDDPDNFYVLYYEDKLRHLRSILPEGMPDTVLDIGAGYGDFLKYMKQNGWKISGIEPSKEATDFSKDQGLGIHQAPFEELLNLGFEQNSVVTLNHVLEHLRDPVQVLLDVKNNLLSPGGILSLAIPNDFSPLQYLQMKTTLKENDEKQHYWLAPPEHLNYWTIDTITSFLDKLGFRVEYYSSTFPMEMFPLMGEDYVSNPEVGRSAHLKQVNFEKNLKLAGDDQFKDELYNTFAKLGLGRSILIYARAV